LFIHFMIHVAFCGRATYKNENHGRGINLSSQTDMDCTKPDRFLIVNSRAVDA
jgi:hypothetical protein